MLTYFLSFNTSNSYPVLYEDKKAFTGKCDETSPMFDHSIHHDSHNSQLAGFQPGTPLFCSCRRAAGPTQPAETSVFFFFRLNEHQSLRYFNRQMIKTSPRVVRLFFPYFTTYRIYIRTCVMYTGCFRGYTDTLVALNRCVTLFWVEGWWYEIKNE
jgi:hypothetical protein